MGTNWTVDTNGNSIGATYTASSTSIAGKPINQLTTIAINAISSPTPGMFAYDTTLNVLKVYNGTQWQIIESASGLGTMAFQNAISVEITGGTANFGTNSSQPSSAALSVTSTTQGIGWPSMTSTQRLAITSPANITVFDNTLNQFMGYNGTAWIILG